MHFSSATCDWEIRTQFHSALSQYILKFSAFEFLTKGIEIIFEGIF